MTPTKTFAYIRVSTTDQNTALQLEAIKEVYPNAEVFEEKVSGTSLNNRLELERMLSMLRTGDKVVCWKIDRLARSMKDLLTIVERIEEAGASFEVLTNKAMNTSTAEGKLFLSMLGSFAEFETNIRKERQLAGIAIAKAKGKYAKPNKGIRKAAAQVEILLNSGTSVAKTAETVGCSVSTVARLKRELKSQGRLKDVAVTETAKSVCNNLRDKNIVEMHKKGIPVAQIAREVGCARNTVYKIIRS